MTSSTSLEAVAQALCDARHQALLYADASLHANALQSKADAYTVQKAVGTAMQYWSSAVPRYWKSGGANREAVLTHAPLPDQGVWKSPAQAGDWRFQHRGVEAEIALRLGRDVSIETAASLKPEDAHALIDSMAVSIEIVDTRWKQPLSELPELLKLADFQVHGALVLGDWRPYERRNWSAQHCRVRIGGQPVVECRGTHPLSDPAWLLPQWLQHVTREFGPVPVGTVVTTGSWVGLLHAAPGDRVEIDVDGVGRVSLQL